MNVKWHNGDQILGNARDVHRSVLPKDQDPNTHQEHGAVSQFDLARLVERISRRFLDYIRLELTRLGVDDISPAQVMVLLNIGPGEIAVRDLLERGHYVGSNASYNLKQLVDSDYLERAASARDRRLSRISLSQKGKLLCERLKNLEDRRQFQQSKEIRIATDLQTSHETLRRLEQWLSDALRYKGALFVSCMSYSFIAQDLANLPV